jgi:hypothetical protein
VPWLGPLALVPVLAVHLSLTDDRQDELKLLLAAGFGAIGGPLAFYSGAKLRATEAPPSLNGMLALAVGWGVMTPLLAWLARVCAGRAERNG